MEFVIETRLNELGQKGWEACFILPRGSNSGNLILKRQIVEPPRKTFVEDEQSPCGCSRRWEGDQVFFTICSEHMENFK